MAVFWVVAPCSVVEVHQRFRGPFCLHHQGATTQKTVIFVLTAVRTSDPAEFIQVKVDNNRLKLCVNRMNVKIDEYIMFYPTSKSPTRLPIPITTDTSLGAGVSQSV
jgi:hypothetical protein